MGEFVGKTKSGNGTLSSYSTGRSVRLLPVGGGHVRAHWVKHVDVDGYFQVSNYFSLYGCSPGILGFIIS